MEAEPERAAAIDADMALETAASTAQRWLQGNEATAPAPTATPDAIRAYAEATVTATAVAMSRAVERIGGDCSKDGAAIADWLRRCLDDIAQPRHETGSERLMRPLGPSPVHQNRKDTARRQWNAGLREQTQRGGIVWLRGRADGPCGFIIGQLGGTWTVFEDGWPTDQQELSRRMIRAAAAALYRQAAAAGQPPMEQAELVAKLEADADRYEATMARG